MLPIDTRKLELPRTVEAEHCDDGSVRLIEYTKPQPAEELLTMQKRLSYYGDSSEYTVSVHLPEQRKVDTVVTLAHTSTNCWKMTVSARTGSDYFTMNTLREVTEELKRVFE